MRWVEDENYSYNGMPMRYEKAVVELCSCHYERLFQKYDPTESFTTKEKGYLFKAATIDNMNREQFKQASDFVRDIKAHMETGTWLYIFGDDARVPEVPKIKGITISAYGTGKTYLMQCMANAFSLRKIPAIYVTEERLFADIKATYNRDSEDSEDEVLQIYYSVPILMIDDIFTAQYKEWGEAKLFSIIDERQKNSKVTIMTSNYSLGRIRERLPLNGGKIGSRINGNAEQIEMLGPDRRPQSKSEPA
ncbi:ATP-binding protein [Paenibacillus sp. P32E]|uniref:ATP-binding protein n=1 Tax=Paenibacillus sp. P32E TaxID=1349434 RepID=UPI00093ABAA9|nr:ATP-binding protein [Paenibacillus sp. P32E]OKP91392.1 hypothetical protein A3848_09820 [Paenibacillus sp. P32E]